MRYNLIEAVLGAVVLAVASYFLVFAYTHSNHRVTKGYTITAKFDRIDGVVTGNDVKISGVKIGVVDKVEVDKNSFRALVTLLINDDVKLPDDTTAEIISESLLGGKYIALIPGVSETNMAPNASIIKTQPAVNFESLISKFLFAKGEDKPAAQTN